MPNITGQQLWATLALALFFFGLGMPTGLAQDAPDAAQETAPDSVAQGDFNFDIIERLAVVGTVRIESETIATYLTVRPGDPFDPQQIDASLKRLFATGLFADVVMERNGNTLVIRVVENPIINRIVFEGNSRLKEDDFIEEVELRPRMVYTRAKVRSDVQRILELYRRSGRFAAVVEPQVIQRDQNRVDLVFEISEGPKSRVSRIQFVGNRIYTDRKLRGILATTESRWWKVFGSNDTYDPDRMQFDREEVRQFYLDNGYADIRIVSAVAELTPDQRDFYITFVIEEGEKYTFGTIDVESEIRSLPAEFLKTLVTIQEGKSYTSKGIEDTIERLTNTAGILGFAFLDVRPQIDRDREARTISINFFVREVPRTYIERIDIHGNLRTLDKVVRREFRLSEGDAFNSLRVERSEQRLAQLQFFKNVEIEQLPGSDIDKVVLDVTVEEQPTGEFSLGIGYSNFDGFIFDTSISERNLLGKGQSLTLAFLLSGRRNNLSLSFSQPYFLGRNMLAGFSLFRQGFENREAGFETTSTGVTFNVRFPIAEYILISPRYTLRTDNVVIPGEFTNPFITDSLGSNTTSLIGITLNYANLDNFRFPSYGQSVTINQDFAGLGGNIRYLRTSIDADFYRPIIGGWIGHIGFEGGHIIGIDQRVRINNRFFLGSPRFRGFDVGGVGPYDAFTGQFLGGNTFFVATVGTVIPLGEFAEELGFQVSAYFDVGTLFNAEFAEIDANGNPIDNSFVIDNKSLRMSAGIGITWDSPFGPVRLDFARVLRSLPTDRTESISFNVGTRF